MPVGIFNGLRRFDVCVCRDCKDRCGGKFFRGCGQDSFFSLVVITCSSVFLGIIGSPFLYFDMMDALSAMTISGCGFVDVFFLVLCMGADHSSLFCALHAGIWSEAFVY